ncbi:MAG: heparan-alpha-glucosaminide N-acetyltransferase domain-containing protein [Ignavibacteriaceae bacterium]|nr:heparan-alpha-glucosaminide N-acetyltransferase domain-containing protein [Ignavibacteriaceae bacterium]
MTQSSKKNRIIFIDLMRAFAVIQMVQGHTVDVLLSNDYRSFNSPFFAFWFFMRGMTAPIFLFTAGTVFTYLFKLVNEPFATNPRVKKGIKRFFLLIFLGYLLRYPTPSIIDFSNVTADAWRNFFAIDVLHLIGFGIFFLMVFLLIGEKFKINDYVVFSAGALLFFCLYQPFSIINWLKYVPAWMAGYFYNGSGSNFPLFPWAGYVIAGGLLGSFLAKHPTVFKSIKFSYGLAAFGVVFIVLALLGNEFEILLYGHSSFWTTSPSLIFYRLGIVLILNSLVSIIALKVKTIPRIFILIGRNTLLIYIVHLTILYGSAWNPGLISILDKSLNVWNTIGMVLLMLTAMTFMVVIIHWFKIQNKQAEA